MNSGNSLHVDVDFVLRCLLAVSGLGVRFDLDVLRKRENIGLVQQNYSRCCEAIGAAIDFAVKGCGCASHRLIGSLNTLIPFVFYLYHLEKPRIPKSEFGSVKKAFFLVALGRPFSPYGESRLAKFLREGLQPLVQKGSTTFPLSWLVEYESYWDGIDAFDIELLRRNVHLTLHIIQGDSGVDVKYIDNAPELDHIFPRKLLGESERKFGEAEISHPANFWILPKEKNINKRAQHPATYLADVSDVEINSALIDRSFLNINQYRTFLKDRTEKILAKISEKTGLSQADFDEVWTEQE